MEGPQLAAIFEGQKRGNQSFYLGDLLSWFAVRGATATHEWLEPLETIETTRDQIIPLPSIGTRRSKHFLTTSFLEILGGRKNVAVCRLSACLW